MSKPNFRKRYGEVLRVGFPLVMSMAATNVMQFTDRAFLANYSVDAIAAAGPAGITAWLITLFFSGVAGYLIVFIAQYTGENKSLRIGACLWQGIHFSIVSGLILVVLALIAKPLFQLGGHAPAIQRLEVIYFQILCWGGGFNVLCAALPCFFSGRGHTRTVMTVSIIGMVFNIPLDFVLIFGMGPIPAMGIAGAAVATISAAGLMALIYARLIFNRRHDRQFGVLRHWRFEGALFFRILKYGIPGSVQFCMDVFAFAFFAFMVGRIGTTELAVTNIVLSINSLAFMPAMGFSMAISTLVGQALGRNQPEAATAALHNTLHLLLVYTLVIGLIFILIPHKLLALFIGAHAGTAGHQEILSYGKILMRIVVGFVLFDALYMAFTGLLKGAGDTHFIMWSMSIAAIVVMIIPIYVGIQLYGAGLYYAWGCVTLFIIALCGTAYWRYRQGKWRAMRVTQEGVAALK